MANGPLHPLAELASMSWIAGLPEADRRATVERMRTLVVGGETPSELPVHFVIGLTRAFGSQ